MNLIRIIFIGLLSSACARITTVNISSEILDVRISEVDFSGKRLQCCAADGRQNSNNIRLDRNENTLEGPITFLMQANGRQVRLTTQERFSLDAYEEITITLEPSTPVILAVEQ